MKPQPPRNRCRLPRQDPCRRRAISEIQATSIEDDDEEFGGNVLLGEKGDTPSMTDPNGGVSMRGRRLVEEWGIRGAAHRAGDREIGRVRPWRLMRG
jgi:hypothetical protein